MWNQNTFLERKASVREEKKETVTELSQSFITNVWIRLWFQSRALLKWGRVGSTSGWDSAGDIWARLGDRNTVWENMLQRNTWMCMEWWNVGVGQENESSQTPSKTDFHFLLLLVIRNIFKILIRNWRNEMSFFSHEWNPPTVQL